MKLFALLNSLLPFFGGTAVAIAMHLYRDPPEYILDNFPKEYAITYTSVGVDAIIMLVLSCLGCYATLESNLNWRRVMLVLYMAVMWLLLFGEIFQGVSLLLYAKWALDYLPPQHMNPKLKPLLQKVIMSGAQTVDWIVVAWLVSLFLLQAVAITMAYVETRRAINEMRLRSRAAIQAANKHYVRENVSKV